ncbi:MAG: hypothetical protein H0V81_17170 [Solirubrobacterales bacterium]|nr:hypothetical protein [Solirubrobacterales bacterium]
MASTSGPSTPLTVRPQPGGPIRPLATCVALVIAAVAAGCGSSTSSPPDQGAVAPATQSAGFGHIHGLGGSGEDLVIATHTGLWRAASGERRATRIGTSQRDVMGFTAVGDRLFGSGHPDPAEATGEPGNVGLITSVDAGATWRPVALAGEADFHALTGSGETLYGYDGASASLLVSEDAGRSWQARSGAPDPVISLAADPSDPKAVLAATPEGVQLSRDGGRSFAPTDAPAGLLAWGPKGAFAVAADGSVRRAEEAGGAWRTAGSIGALPVAAHASEDGALYVAREDGTVLVSTDRGNEFVERARLG